MKTINKKERSEIQALRYKKHILLLRVKANYNCNKSIGIVKRRSSKCDVLLHFTNCMRQRF